MTATGSIYVQVEGEEKDIFVNQRNTANALNGDRVEVVVMHRGRDGKLEGEITRIVERSRKPYVGIAEVGAHQIFVRADSRRMPMDIYLSKRAVPRREGRRKGRRAHRRLGRREQKPRGRTGRAAGHGGQQRHRDARHPGRIRAALPLRARSRAGGRGHRRPDHGQGDRPAPRFPQCDDLHGRPGRRQGLRRRAVGTQSRGRRMGEWAYISPT